MADQEQLDILRLGTLRWNDWRTENPSVKLHLQEANLRGIDLEGAELSGANLRGADLSEAKLSGANLEDAELQEASLPGANLSSAVLRRASLSQANFNFAILESADLQEANLSGADFSGASLRGSDLSEGDLRLAVFRGADLSKSRLVKSILRWTDMRKTNLSNADLREADLSWVDFFSSKLDGTNFEKAVIDRIMFGGNDLSKAQGLDKVIHRGSSSVGVDTIYKSAGNIDESFLLGCGVPDIFITYMRSLVVEPIEFYSCFISYSSKDQAFVERLYADLQAAGVRCWYAPENLQIGDLIQPQIDQSIRLHDKVILVLSESSVSSSWVGWEVKVALKREEEQRRTILFPIRLDDEVMRVEGNWSADIRRSRHIANFQDWKSYDSYQKAFKRLLRDLISDRIESE